MGLNRIKPTMVIGEYQALARYHFARTKAAKVNHDIVKAAGTAF